MHVCMYTLPWTPPSLSLSICYVSKAPIIGAKNASNAQHEKEPRNEIPLDNLQGTTPDQPITTHDPQSTDQSQLAPKKVFYSTKHRHMETHTDRHTQLVRHMDRFIMIGALYLRFPSETTGRHTSKYRTPTSSGYPYLFSVYLFLIHHSGSIM